MSVVTPPRAGVILGFVKVGERDLPVTISDEYMRWLAALMQRIGGIKSIDLDELAAMVVSPVVPALPDETPPPAFSVEDVIARAEDAARQQAIAVLAEAAPVPDYAADIAVLREGGASVGASIRRIEQHTIDINSASLAATYTITGLVGPYELRYLGCNSDDNRVAGAIVSLTRSGAVITATRNLTGFNTRASFEFTEYNP